MQPGAGHRAPGSSSERHLMRSTNAR
jgi:hypothetical protein